jgi:thiol-disulfide isomerase/thioredoxin
MNKDGGFELADVNKKAEFDEKIKNHKYIVVKYHSEGCGHCRKLGNNHHTKLKSDKDLKDLDLKFLNIEVYQCEKELTSNLGFEIVGVPTIALFKDSKNIGVRSGADVNGIIDFIKKNFLKESSSESEA